MAVAVGALAAVAAVGLAGAWAVWGDPARWGCPSQHELSRAVPDDRVREAFARRGLVLHVWRRRGSITTYVAQAGAASVFVNVCATNCVPDDGLITHFGQQVGPVVFLRNLGMVVVGKRAAAAPLRGAVLAVADGFDGPNRGDRCYVG